MPPIFKQLGMLAFFQVQAFAQAVEQTTEKTVNQLIELAPVKFFLAGLFFLFGSFSVAYQALIVVFWIDLFTGLWSASAELAKERKLIATLKAKQEAGKKLSKDELEHLTPKATGVRSKIMFVKFFQKFVAYAVLIIVAHVVDLFIGYLGAEQIFAIVGFQINLNLTNAAIFYLVLTEVVSVLENVSRSTGIELKLFNNPKFLLKELGVVAGKKKTEEADEES